MTIAAGIAIASVWAATSFAVYTFQKDMTAVGLIVCLIIAASATAYIAGIKP